MESIGRTVFLLFCTTLFILSGVNCELVRVPALLHGVRGKPLLLPVETHFRLEDAVIQGNWHQIRPHYTHLVTFQGKMAIFNMEMQDRNLVSFQPPNASLLLRLLDEASEGEYRLEINIKFPHSPSSVKVEKHVHVTVDVPVSTPGIEKSPASEFVEDKDNVTWKCSVENGTRVQYQWLKNNVPVSASERHLFSQNNDTLVIDPVRKEDIGQYSCVVKNYINRRQSQPVDLSVFYGPYNLAVNSDQGLRTGWVFTVNPGELVFFDCWADSNPPNSCVWISKTRNGTEVLMTGPRFQVTSYELAQAKEFLCRAFNNVTQKQDETQFTLVVASLVGTGKEKHVQKGSFMSPLAAVTISSLVIIVCMLLVLFRKTCPAKRAIINIYKRPITEQKRPHRSGHEDATEDFGIYEFVAIPGKMESTQASSRSLAHLDSVQDLHTTIYDVIRRIPETPTLSLLK